MVAAAERPGDRRAVHGRVHLPAGARRSRWRGGWSPPAGSATSATSARSTCRTGSPTRRRRCRGGCRRTGRAPAPSATSAHIVDLTQFITGERITGVSGLLETFVKERPLPSVQRPVRRRRHRARRGHRRRRGGVPGPVQRRRAGDVRGDPVRHRAQELDPDRGQRFGREPGLRLRGHERPARSTTTPPTPRRRVPRVLVTEPDHPYVAAWWPPATCSVTSTASPTRRSTWSPRSPRNATRSRRSPTASQVQRVLAAVEQSAGKDSVWTETGA